MMIRIEDDEVEISFINQEAVVHLKVFNNTIRLKCIDGSVYVFNIKNPARVLDDFNVHLSDDEY